MNESDLPLLPPTGTDSSPTTNTVVPHSENLPTLLPSPAPMVNPVRSAAGRRGGQRVHQLAELGREYEKEHGLKAGRQRLKQLVQLGRKYEAEHGLRAAKPRREKKGDAWLEFLATLARVVKPAHRAAVEQLASALRPVAPGAVVDTSQA